MDDRLKNYVSTIKEQFYAPTSKGMVGGCAKLDAFSVTNSVNVGCDEFIKECNNQGLNCKYYISDDSYRIWRNI